VAKVYYYVDTRTDVATYAPIIGDITMTVDEVERRLLEWEEWAISARVDASDCWRTAQAAVLCHTPAGRGPAWPHGPARGAATQPLGDTCLHPRAFGLVNGGRRLEGDLFEGIR
jgi:hypothetical protein